MDDILFSSGHQEWETPKELFNRLNEEFNFTLDAAASGHNSKCDFYLDAETDALTKPWIGRVFLNPPYGKMIGKFIQKAYEEAQQNAELVVCLIPARTDTAYWHDYVMKAAEIRLIRGRVKFGVTIDGQKLSFATAPFPSAIIVFIKGSWNPRLVAYMQKTKEMVDKDDDCLLDGVDDLLDEVDDLDF